MNCPTCQFTNPTGARFCAQCGTRLTARCPVCAQAVEAAQRFCTDCGHALPGADGAPSGAELGRTPASYTPRHLAERILADRDSLRGEKKQVTVLFCDMVDSTVLARELGAEAMHDLLSEFFALALAEVHRFEGTVNQFLGDGFMAIFGAPLASEDHAARAGLAAIAIGDALDRMRTAAAGSSWSRVQVRMGINSGQVVVGAIGDDLRMDYTASGDTTHLAARLQGLAQPGEILCGASTVELAHGALTVAPLVAVMVKGLDLPLARYQLLRASAHTSRAAQRRAPFVGRAAELEQLLGAVARAQAGQGGVIEVEGEPGAGKSRLMLEFRTALPHAVRCVDGQCITYGKQRPNLPIIELARGLLGMTATGSDDGRTPAQPADNRMAATAIDYLAALIGVAQAQAAVHDMDPATVRGRTVDALVRRVLGSAQVAPLVLIIEDLHWVDASTQEFLAAVANVISAVPCLMIVTFRPGSAPPWSAASRRARLQLAPLTSDDSLALLRALPQAAALSELQQQQVLARAEGNPFFLEELVRAAAEGDDDVPGDVFDVLGARVDRLDSEDRRRLRIAAVIGRQFSLDLLEEVAATPDGERTRLDHLTALGFVTPLPAARSCQFVHALTQEVVYQTMLSAERRELHGAVAARLQYLALDPEQSCEEIAHHLLASRTPQTALPYLETATAKAIRKHTLDAAYHFFADALRLFEAEPTAPAATARAVVYLLQCFPVFHFLHRHIEYAALIERYVPAVEAMNLPALSGAFYAQYGHRLWVQARYVEAIAAFERAIPLCAAAGDAVNAAHAALMACWTWADVGDCARGEAAGQQALAFLAQAPVPMLTTFAHVGLMQCQKFRGRWRAAIAHSEQARDVGVIAGDDGLAAFGGAFLADALYESGDTAAAIAAGQTAIAVAPTDYFRGWALAYTAIARCAGGQDAEALGILDYAVGLARDAGHVSGSILIGLALSEARLRAGQHAQAGAEARAIREHAQNIGFPYVAAGALQVLAEIALLDGDPTQAAAMFRQAQAEHIAIDSRLRAAHARAGCGRALLALGERASAQRELAAAAVTFTQLELTAAADEIHPLLATL